MSQWTSSTPGLAQSVQHGPGGVGGRRLAVCLKKKPPSPAASFKSAEIWLLLELSRDAGELVVELGAQAIDHGDTGDRNAGSDQAIFYGGSPRIVLQERN